MLLNRRAVDVGSIHCEAAKIDLGEEAAMSVARLSDRVRCDLTYRNYPARDWTVPRYRGGVRVLDVLIVGGGQGGLAAAFGLKLERITNIRIVDRNPRGREG